MLHAPGRTGCGLGELCVDAGWSSTVILVGSAVAVEERVDDLEDGGLGVGRQALEALETAPDANVDLDRL